MAVYNLSASSVSSLSKPGRLPASTAATSDSPIGSLADTIDSPPIIGETIGSGPISGDAIENDFLHSSSHCDTVRRH